MEEYFVFTDGAAYNNGCKDPTKPQACASGVVIVLRVDKREEILFSGSAFFPNETISYAELRGALIGIVKASETFGRDVPIQLWSDSQFVIKGWNEWMPGWIRRGWKNNQNEPVGQLELWQKLKKLMTAYGNFTFHHVKGHVKKSDFAKMTPDEQFRSRMNDLADQLATARLAKHLPEFLEEYENANK